MSKKKKDAWLFLTKMRDFLNDRIPPPSITREVIARKVQEARSLSDQRHMAFQEGAFLNQYVAPGINEFLISRVGLREDGARQALLSESYRRIPEWASGTPVRSAKHPFRKVLGKSAQSIAAEWLSSKNGSGLVQACPDMAIRPPAPVKVVIEGKYFNKGGTEAAARSLAVDLYQAFFYLGLSHVEESSTHAAWDYDYACLVAYDATDEGSLLDAWEALDSSVRYGFWEGANIFVMILRGMSCADTQCT